MRGWVKLNVDGSYISYSGQIAIDVVLRDQNRRWIRGFAAAKGFGSIVEDEIWAVMEGMSMAWADGHKKVQVNSDSHEASPPPFVLPIYIRDLEGATTV
ncbi:hypothetical protein ACOSP7_002572 [Xanthoceras sorbifolium]